MQRFSSASICIHAGDCLTNGGLPVRASANRCVSTCHISATCHSPLRSAVMAVACASV